MRDIPEEAVRAARNAIRRAGDTYTEMAESALTAAFPFLSVQGAVSNAKIEAARKAVEELAYTPMNLPLEDWSRISSAILSALEPSAARELALEDGDLNARLTAKGMYSIDEMMGSLPLDKWRVHSGMTDLKFFGEWLERKTREYCTMRAAYEVGEKDESDDLHEWVLAHYGAFHDVLVNFRAALSSPDHADAGEVEGDGWLPIECAPKDGTAVLVHFIPNEVPSLKPLICAAYWQKSDGLMKPGFWRVIHSVGPSFTATHWRPLPSAPSQEVAGS